MDETMKFPKVSIIILNWNELMDCIECLESLKNITYPNYEVIIVDNGSKGNDADSLEKKYGNYLTVIRNDKNAGIAGGNNTGMRHALKNANPDYILLLNNDMTYATDFLAEMVKASESDPLIGIVGPRTYLSSDPNRLQVVWLDVDMQRARSYPVGSGEIDRGQYNDCRYVDYIQGSCFLIKRSVIDSIGLLDEDYFAFWEETDYCIRARKAGYKILYVPSARIWHKRSPTRIKPWYKTLRRRDQVDIASNVTSLRVYLSIRNNFRFLKKHATRPQYFSFLFYLFSYLFWWQCAIFLLYYRNPRLVWAFLRGVGEGLSLKG